MYGEIIKKIRKERKMSLRAFAKLVDVDFTYIGLLEREKSTSSKRLNPTIDILQQICTATDYPFAKFLAEAGYISAIDAPEGWKDLSPDQKGKVKGFIEKLIKDDNPKPAEQQKDIKKSL